MLSFLNKPLLFSFVFFGLASQILAQTSEPLLSFSSFPDDINLSCSDGMPSEIEYPIVALDTLGTSCNGTQSLFYLDLTVPGDCPNSYVLQRTWSAEICGETISSLQSFTFSDTTPPVIIRPIDGAHLCEIDLVNIYPAAQDNCQSYVSLNFNASESIPCEGVTLRTYDITVSDNCGNTTIESRSIYIHDQAPPTFSSVPTSLTLSCEDAVILESATYDCEMGMTYSEGGEVSYPNCSGSFVQTQTYSLTDVCGATANASRVITVEDNIPPILEIPEDLSLSCPEVPVLELATAFDVCTNENLAVVEEIDTVVSNCGLMTLVRTFSATDACGNTASGFQTITVTDTIAPVFTTFPADTVLSCAGDIPLELPTFEDVCSTSSIIETLSEELGGCPGERNVTRTFTISDPCGNTDTRIQSIAFTDTTPPTFEVVPPDFLEVYWLEGDTIPFPVTEILDDCDPNAVLTMDESSSVDESEGADFAQTIMRTYLATDGCQNSTTFTSTIVYYPQIIHGCTDVTACNYDPQATEEDNSCIEDPVGFDCNGVLTPNEFCGTGTVWNADSGECEVVTFGPACYFDTNYNGTVDSADLLTLLSAYGLSCQ